MSGISGIDSEFQPDSPIRHRGFTYGAQYAPAVPVVATGRKKLSYGTELKDPDEKRFAISICLCSP